MTVAGAAIAACEYVAAREAMQPLLQGSEPPTARMCLLMAELEEAEHGDGGYAREWLARASRAPRDACWIADGLISEQWLPASPVTGKLDAFIWKKPDQPLGGKAQAEEAIFKAVAPPAKPAALLEKDEPAAIPPPAKAGTPQPGSSSPLPAAQPGEGVGGAGEEPRPVSAEAQVRRGEAKDSAPKAAGAH
jgi:HemY protein